MTQKNDSNGKKNDLVKIGAVWTKKNKKGEMYLSGKMQEDVIIPAGAGLLILPNAYKDEGERRPDYNVLMSPVQADQEG